MATAQNISPPPITADQYEAFEGFLGLRDELIDGRIVLSPQPKPLHQQLADNIRKELERCLFGSSYIVNGNSNLDLGDRTWRPAPDLFAVTRAAWVSACHQNRYLSEPPLLTVEVISPANEDAEVRKKLDFYLSHGVRQVCIVHPQNSSIVVHGSGQMEPDQLVLAAPLNGIIDAADILRLSPSV